MEAGGGGPAGGKPGGGTTLTADERLAYLALTLAPGIGPARFQKLLSVYGTAVGALSAVDSKAAALGLATKAVDDADRSGVRILFPAEADFPASLQNIPDAPPVLYAAGEVSLLDRPAVAIVGSRDHSAYGASICRAVATAAARAGVVIVSGMARGLDAVAHTAALDCGGATIGVLGNGHGVVYPAANRVLYERVSRHGLLLSEFPPGERPHAGSFPRRNRLISGLATVTVVVEAAAGSGALITAGTALDQGREVLAVPGNVTSAVSVGTNRLIRDGAAPLLEPADLLQHFPDLAATHPTPSLVLVPGMRPLPENLTLEERELALLCDTEPVHPDQLATRSRRPVGEVLGLLSALEIAGVVEQGPGRIFRRI
jgi:DNA processing protein